MFWILWASPFLYSHNQCIRDLIPSHCYQHLVFSEFPYYSHPSGYELVPHCGFHFYVPNDEWCWAFFHMVVGHYKSFLENHLIISSVHFVIELFVFLCWAVRVFYIFWILNTYQIICKSYFLLHRFSFSFLDNVLWFTVVFNLMRSSLSKFSFFAHAFGVILESPLLSKFIKIGHLWFLLWVFLALFRLLIHFS